MFGKSYHGLFGTTNFFISINDKWVAAFFMFQAVFVGTAATIDSGAICGRAKLKQYIFLSFIVSIFIYPVFGHWVWGSYLLGTNSAGAGWLEAIGFKDFAGSSVVHSVGGWMALSGIIILGPRIGKFIINPTTGKKEKSRQFQPGDMRFVFLGVFILFFAWYGFNCGSTLKASSDIPAIALNTTLSACFGCLASSILSWIFHPQKKIEGGMIANGALGGLVGITAGCAYVNTIGAAIIGIVSGIIVFSGVNFIERILKLDDVVGAVSVHGFWGTIAVGLFIKNDMLGDKTRGSQILVQLIGAVSCFIWAFGTGILFYFLTDKLSGGIRVSKKDEIVGLNVAEHGATSSILELANTMDEMTRTGNFKDHKGIEVEYGTEAGDLANLFNKMIFKINEALQESKNQENIAKISLEESQRQKQLAIDAKNELEKMRVESKEKRHAYISQAQNMIGLVLEKAVEISKRMEKTTEVTNEMYQSSHDLTKTLNKMLSTLSEVYIRMDNISSITSNASVSAANTRFTISELKQITTEITSMVNFINEISQKTHILSINTSIEASKIAQANSGFNVISKEIRNLSKQTSSTAANISEKVKGIEQKISNVVNSMDEIVGIVEQIEKINKTILSIIGRNEEYTQTLEIQSKGTITAVENVNDNIASMASDVKDVNKIAHKVKKDLKEIE